MSYKKRYDTLYADVIKALTTAVKNSKYKSEHTGTPAFPVQEIHDAVYTEITIVNDNLVFLDAHGYQYDAERTVLEGLVDVLENYTNFCTLTYDGIIQLGQGEGKIEYVGGRSAHLSRER